jgi:hypothetical protein
MDFYVRESATGPAALNEACAVRVSARIAPQRQRAAEERLAVLCQPIGPTVLAWCPLAC